MTTNATASPHGDYIAYMKSGYLLKQSIRRREPTTQSACKLPLDAKVSTLKWSADGSQILINHDRGLQVVDSKHRSSRVFLKNGTGGLGRVVTADFIGNEHLLVVWEFGKAKLWHMNSGKAVDLPDFKTMCDGQTWQVRPGNRSPPLFAVLSRIGAEDHLSLHFPSLRQPPPPSKLPTIDAQSISWSPDGRWLAVLDVPTASQSLHIYTPDGHLFRSYPSAKEAELGLGIKSIAWSADGRVLALTKFDGLVELLNTKTFTRIAMIEHSTTIYQHDVEKEYRAPVWQEAVSASNERSYTPQQQPFSPPLSKAKAGSEPQDLGVAEICFSCDDSYLATRDCRMLNTVWIWNMATLGAHAVLIQHSNVRRLKWHPTRPDTLMVDCAEGFAHIWNVSSREPPLPIPTGGLAKAKLTWLEGPTEAKPIIMVTEPSRFHLLYPEGQDELSDPISRRPSADESEQYDEGNSEDSLFQVLSGRKPLPPKTQPSYTQMVDLEMEGEDDLDGGLDDTFREKRKAVQQVPMEVDPLDDSEIF
ncbi:hypothetical protein M409DRAFT_21638 [Zasmidium cellare ATCC 36951]|uniref:Uncharacterized protein n=1 Tax=Zasmidium cellare ATCC 36951 TaxID=1080233 RepID=A0A6A6CLX9_ZASCE|nr:uncharacterized protein M409DRAFT_21638 [Zasmidium cellare ATCC 36951]KAF2168194.1 hypothetical protein M409DRAFT_21638 [Zasmidium cellare ATCC 36951]